MISIYSIFNILVNKTIINRLPPKTILWSRFSEMIEIYLVGNTGLDLGCGTGSQLSFKLLEWYGIDRDFPSLLLASKK